MGGLRALLDLSVATTGAPESWDNDRRGWPGAGLEFGMVLQKCEKRGNEVGLVRSSTTTEDLVAYEAVWVWLRPIRVRGA